MSGRREGWVLAGGGDWLGMRHKAQRAPRATLSRIERGQPQRTFFWITLYISMATSPVTMHVVVAMAGMILPAVILTSWRDASLIL